MTDQANEGAANAGTLSPEERLRYARHLLLPEVGRGGQERLRAARVVCVGAGGLGSPLLLYLAAAGVGTIGLVDFDTVEASNLQRQVVYGSRDVGLSKLQAAAARLSDLNPNVRVVPHEVRLSSKNALAILRDYDVIADGTDNFPTRYLVADSCVLLDKPNVYASVYRFEGQASVFWASRGPCYRCAFPEPPPPELSPSCAEAGVLGVLPGLLGLLQATEVLKLILGIGEPLLGRLLLVDSLAMTFRTLRLRKDPACVLCGERPTVTALVDYEALCGVANPTPPAISVEEFRERLRARTSSDRFMVLDVREPAETALSAFAFSVKIPLARLPENLSRLSRSDEIVVHCKSGARSARAVQDLLSAGFSRTWNLTGGLDAWILKYGAPENVTLEWAQPEGGVDRSPGSG